MSSLPRPCVTSRRSSVNISSAPDPGNFSRDLLMNNRQFDVTAIGNAIVDVIAKAEDALLAQHKLAKGAMSLIDAADAERLYAVMGPGHEASGGSAANTAAGIALLGGRTAYI